VNLKNAFKFLRISILLAVCLFTTSKYSFNSNSYQRLPANFFSLEQGELLDSETEVSDAFAFGIAGLLSAESLQITYALKKINQTLFGFLGFPFHALLLKELDFFKSNKPVFHQEHIRLILFPFHNFW